MNKNLQNILLRRRNAVEIPKGNSTFLENETKNLLISIQSLVDIKLANVNIDSIEIINSNDMLLSMNNGAYIIKLTDDGINLDIINDMDKISQNISDILNDLESIMTVTRNKIKDEINRKQVLVCSVAKNFESLGYSLSENAFNALMKLDDNDINKFYNNYQSQLEKIVGANVEYKPMYPNFPKQVMEMSDVELYLNALVHYWSFGTLLPDYEKLERPELTETTKYKYLDVAKENELENIITNLMAANVSIGPAEKEDLKVFAENVENWKDYIPANEMPNKENMAFVASMILEEANKQNRKATAKDFKGMFKTPTDILRFIVSQSIIRETGEKGNVSLDNLNNVVYGSEVGKMRNLILELLEETSPFARQDILKYENAWKRISEKIHPASNKNKYPHAAEVLGVEEYELLKTIKPLLKELSVYETIGELSKIESKYKELVDNKCKFKNKYIGKDPDEYIVEQIFTLKSKIDTSNISNDIKDKINKFVNKFETEIIDKQSKKVELTDLLIQIESNYELRRHRKNSFLYDKEDIDEVEKKIKTLKTEAEELKSNISKTKDVQLKDIISSFDFNMIIDRKNEINSIIAPTLEKINKMRETNKRIEQKLDKFMKSKDYNGAIELLSKYPGVFARHLDELLRKYVRTDDILDAFEKVSNQIAPSVLMQVKSHIEHRNENTDYRAFTSCKGDFKIYVTDNIYEPLSNEICEKVSNICKQALINEFKGKQGYNKVYMDKQFEKQIVPNGIRNATKGKETYVRGSRFELEKADEKMARENAPFELDQIRTEIKNLYDKIVFVESSISTYVKAIKDMSSEEVKEKSQEVSTLNNTIDSLKKELEPLKKELFEKEKKQKSLEELLVKEESKYVRGFIWWTDKNSGNNYDDRVDIDLSAVLYDENCKYSGHVSYTNLRNNDIVHSGDIVSGGPENGSGVAEFIDFDPEKVIESGARYISFQVNSFTGQSFKELPNISFGWMERDSIDKGEIFEPKTVKQKLDLSSSTQCTIPVMFDCVTKEFIWIDTNLDVDYCSNVESTRDKTQAILKTFIEPHKETLANLIRFNIEANGGEFVDVCAKLESGDVAFVMDYPKNKIEGVTYIRPMDIDIIMNDLMREATKEEKEKLTEINVDDVDINR